MTDAVEPEYPGQYEYGVGDDTISAEEELVNGVDEADNGLPESADLAEPQGRGLVCRNNVNTLIIRQKNYPWFSA